MMRCKREVGGSQWVCSLALRPGNKLSEWVESFPEEEDWVQAGRLQFGHGASPLHQRLLGPSEGTLSPRPQQGSVKKDEPGLVGRTVPPCPWCCGTRSLCILEGGKM